MREFTDMTVIPGTFFVSVDGEGYHCDPFAVVDVQGATRLIPGTAILAIHWHGRHGHGHVEGHGPLEGVADRAQVEPYLSPWLASRARAKQARADDLVRKRSIELEQIDALVNVKTVLAQQIADLHIELDAASADRRASVQAQIDVVVRSQKNLEDTINGINRRLTNPEEIASAQGEADQAAKEAA
jgi:hypothetical protein